MRVLVIDNYLTPGSPEIEKLYEVLQEVTIHTVEIRDYTTLSRSEEFKNVDIIVLSGSSSKLSEPGVSDSYAIEADVIKAVEKPLLGICFGHQLLGLAYGEPVHLMEETLKGYYMVQKQEEDELFEGIGDRFLVMQSHTEYIKELPYDFIKLADSPTCAIEIMKHRILPKYGVQFHPERFDDKHPAGLSILENFFTLAAWYVK